MSRGCLSDVFYVQLISSAQRATLPSDLRGGVELQILLQNSRARMNDGLINVDSAWLQRVGAHVALYHCLLSEIGRYTESPIDETPTQYAGQKRSEEASSSFDPRAKRPRVC